MMLPEMIEAVLYSNKKRGRVTMRLLLSVEANRALNPAYFESKAPGAEKYLREYAGVPVLVTNAISGKAFIVEGENTRVFGFRFSNLYREGMIMPAEVVADNAEKNHK